MTLREYSKSNNISYSKAWRMFSSGQIAGKKDSNGQIILGADEPQKQAETFLAIPWEPLYTETAFDRDRRTTSEEITKRYDNIENTLLPFSPLSNNYGGQSDITARDSIVLCQKAYFGFSVFRNTIDLMSEFCTGNIHFIGGSKKSQDIFKAYWNKIGLSNIQDMFFREYFRSGNVFFYRIDGNVNLQELKKINQALADAKMIPIRYSILNPADINAAGNISFANIQYYKILTDYELERLRNPRTPEDKQVLDSLGPEAKQQIQQKVNSAIIIPLDVKKVIAIFYKKQDYEAFAVPLGFPVLDDLNYKKELKIMDSVLARKVQQAILLITMGATPADGGVNPAAMQKMQEMFQNQSIARVVVSDYTTEAKFIIPDIHELFDPKKYEVVDRDIAIGLNNILLGQGEKFANQSGKIDLFVERLKSARKIFLDQFLIPEIKRIADIFGLKNYPTPEYEDIDLKNDVEYSKIYSRLMEIGVLTPEEGIKAINTGTLPTPEDSLESQSRYKSARDKGLYQPLIGGAKSDSTSGRPVGTKAPKSRLNVRPMGGSETAFSITKLNKNILLAINVETEVKNKVKEKYSLTSLNEAQEAMTRQLVEIIATNEAPENWLSKIPEYINNPTDKNPEKARIVEEIAAEYEESILNAAILEASRIDG